MSKTTFRRHLGLPALLATTRQAFKAIDEPSRRGQIPLVEQLMSGLAMFGLKYPSLLQFDRDSRTDEATRHNLRTLYQVNQVSCDTFLRQRLDQLDPGTLRPAYRRLFAALQRGKGLEGYTVLNGHYLLSLDGTGAFSSNIGKRSPMGRPNTLAGSPSWR